MSNSGAAISISDGAKMQVVKDHGSVEGSKLRVKTSTGEYRIAEILASRAQRKKPDLFSYYVHYVECPYLHLHSFLSLKYALNLTTRYMKAPALDTIGLYINASLLSCSLSRSLNLQRTNCSVFLSFLCIGLSDKSSAIVFFASALCRSLVAALGLT
jgi:hypothetical protein